MSARIGILVALVLTLALAACGSSAPVDVGAESSGPALSVAEADLKGALQCNTDLGLSTRSPVLMVHGTTLEPQANFSWNWLPALEALDWPYCTIELPANAMGDIQIAAEYVVYAVREMATASGRKVQIVGHSQGGMVPRWALRFWPDIRKKVDDLIGMSASNHGTVVAPVICIPGCAPSIWQQSLNSNFMAALNRDYETIEGVDYTSIYTNLDEVVFPNVTLLGASSALAGDSSHVANIATQDVCPLNIAEHLLIGTSDAAAYAVAMDALTHEGPAELARVDRAVCSTLLMPGVDPLSFATDFGAMTLVLATTLATATWTSEEPALRCYVDESCP